MNVSLKNKVVWLSPECTGGKVLAKIFQNYDFLVYERNGKLNQRSISLADISWTSKIPETYSSFEKIITLRNPYSRVFDCYENFYNKSLYTRDLDKIKNKFDTYLKKTFIKNNFFYDLDTSLSENSYLSKWNLKDYLPNKVLRYENLEEDLLSLEFIKKNGIKFDQNKLSEIKIDSFDKIDYRLVYNPENAHMVFEYFKNYFYLMGYAPYSFTKEILSENDKINFIHGKF